MYLEDARLLPIADEGENTLNAVQTPAWSEYVVLGRQSWGQILRLHCPAFLLRFQVSSCTQEIRVIMAFHSALTRLPSTIFASWYGITQQPVGNANS